MTFIDDSLVSFWSYELCKRFMTVEEETSHYAAMKVLLCGGIAGIVTWGSVFPLDMIKTRLQAQTMSSATTTERVGLLQTPRKELSSFQMAREVYRAEGLQAFYRGLGVCSMRAFIVNAVQVCYCQFTIDEFPANQAIVGGIRVVDECIQYP